MHTKIHGTEPMRLNVRADRRLFEYLYIIQATAQNMIDVLMASMVDFHGAITGCRVFGQWRSAPTCVCAGRLYSAGSVRSQGGFP